MLLRRFVPCLLLGLFLTLPLVAQAWELAGSKTLSLETRDGASIVLGHIDFVPAGERVHFKIKLDTPRFKDYFLSMREFKCVDGGDGTLCYVPYPYANPASISGDDLAWLEHALLFLQNTRKDYGAKLSRGVYFKLRFTEDGLVGSPEGIDLNMIGSPPEKLDVPPYGPAERSDAPDDRRWFSTLRIR